MNEPDPALDPKLEALFRREHTHLGVEPFLTSTLRRVATDSRRAVVLKRVLHATGLLALVVASPWLIEASVWMSGALDVLFAWLSTAVVGKALVATGLLAAAVAAAIRGRVW
jgi:hypothetical protein